MEQLRDLPTHPVLHFWLLVGSTALMTRMAEIAIPEQHEIAAKLKGLFFR